MAKRGRSLSKDERHRAARLLGDLLPEQTCDDTGDWGDRPDNRDDELRRDVPPHHGV